MKRKKSKRSAKKNAPINTQLLLITAAVVAVILAGAAYFYLLRSLSVKADTEYVYIDDDDSVDSVYTKLSCISNESRIGVFKTLVAASSYADNIHPGRYQVKPRESIYSVFKNIKSGNQTPLNLTIKSVRTKGRLAEEVAKKLMADSADIAKVLNDEKVCKEYGFNTQTIACMFIPNTYDIFWNITPEKFLERMKKEYDRYWNEERMAKAKNLELTPVEVSILASIVDEETANNDEKPMIAGLYYNRVKKGMLLQADPTVKFALQDFGIRRVLLSMLQVDSPYNTYKYPGLPPGPIRIPSTEGLEAVLDMVHHDYIYMCAKEDFSGTHNFAATAQEHEANARKYHAALDARKIKK